MIVFVIPLEACGQWLHTKAECGYLGEKSESQNPPGSEFGKAPSFAKNAKDAPP